MMLLSAPIHQLKRRAKMLARDAKIPLHEAQDRIAQAEGFRSWSLLSSRMAANVTPESLLPALVEGDMILLGARPGHGKTMLGLKLLIDAAREGRRTVLFTLEFTEREAMDRIRSLGGVEHASEIVTSEEIGADFIIGHLTGTPKGTVCVVDYLQILDQQRTKPALGEQLERLARFARAEAVILAFISQIDRSFVAGRNGPPGLKDVRFPNAVSTALFSKACFLHAGEMRLHAIGRH
ncbi:DNA helicase [Sphingosinithalassobacter sp. CS137]|uniref:DNA helicase n=1 Tax=Sphingosinithalassobacter sp. CS137 TaxID=2762748 RepID=UPI001CB74FE8|nr:DNA helicase [Sphingosinithalassobacter sp. CS137]